MQPPVFGDDKFEPNLFDGRMRGYDTVEAEKDVDVDPADMMKYNPLSKSSLQGFARRNEAKILYAGGNGYWIDHSRSSLILIPGNDYEKIQSIKLHPANRPDKAYHGRELEEAARIYMIAYDAIGPAMQKRIDEGEAPYASFVVWAKTGKVTAYESKYIKHPTNGKYTYIRRSQSSGAEISVKDMDIQKRIEDLQKDKFEKEKAYKRPNKMHNMNAIKRA